MKIQDYIRWIITIVLLVFMWRGNTIILYIAITSLVISNELTQATLKINLEAAKTVSNILRKITATGEKE